METIIIENRDEEKSITHPVFGKIRYFIIKGEPQMLRADVAVAFGLNASTSSRMYEFTSFRVRREWETPTRATVACINAEGLKKFAAMGLKNRERRQVVRDWLLKELYHEQIDEPEPLFKDEPAPVTLSPAQMNELVRRVTDLLKLEPLKIALSDKAKEEIVNDVCEQQKKNPPSLGADSVINISKGVTKLFKDQFLKWADQRKAEIVNEAVEDATKLLQAKPIALSEKQMDDIAYKVLALIGDVQPNEDAIVNRVVDKLNARMRITL